MVKQSTPKTFGTGGASKKTAQNSGIFSKSGSGQKRDPQIKASSGQSQGDLGALRGATAMPKKHGAGSGASAAKVQAYALKG